MSRRSSAEQRLQRVGVFSEDPILQERLSRLERNVHAALNTHFEQKAERAQATNIQRSDTHAEFGDCVLYDPTSGALRISLPKVSPTDHGKTIRLKNIGSSVNNAVVAPAQGQLIDGSPTLTLTGALLATELFTDGIGWWVV